MKVYTLTKTDTQQSFSPIDVKTFLTMAQAKKVMFNDVTAECGYKIFEEGLYNGLDGEVDVTCDYARYQFTHWEIFMSEISDKEIIINNFINDLHKMFALPSLYDAVIHDMLNEYKAETLRDKSFNDLYGDIFVGECLYQHALENLGGKPDEKSTSIILEYLNYKFSEKECAKYVTELNFPEDKCLVGMLMLCKGDKDIINDVRQSIDNSQPIDGKIFEKELSENSIKISSSLETDLICLKYKVKYSLLINIAANIMFKNLEEIEQHDDLFEILTECVEVYNNEIEIDDTLFQRLENVLNRYVF